MSQHPSDPASGSGLPAAPSASDPPAAADAGAVEALAPAARRRVLEAPLGWGVARFGAPLALGMALYSVFNLVDMYMLSRLDEAKAALAALGICDMVIALTTIFCHGLSNGSVAIVSRRMGEGDDEGVRRATWQSLVLVGGLSALVGVAGALGSHAFMRDVMQAQGDVVWLAGDYLQVMLGGSFSMFFLLQITAALRALGHATPAAALLVSGNLLNVVLNAVFIYGPGPAPDLFAWGGPVAELLGVPRLGMAGAAWATVIGRTLPALVGLVMLAARVGSGRRLGWADLRPSRPVLRELWRVGWPSSAQLVLRVGAVLILLMLVNVAYTSASDINTLTAYSICLRLEVLFLFVGMGWGAAASTYMGANLGAGQPQRAVRAGWIAAAWGAGSALALVALVLGWPEAFVAFFDDTPAVVARGRHYLQIVGVSYALLTAGIVLSQAIVGAGATMASFKVDAVVILGALIPSSVLVSVTLNLPPTALWTALALSNVAAVLAFVLYYRRGSFASVEV